MRIQEYRPRHNCVSIDRLAESPIENWKDTKNKLHQKLCHYFDIIERVLIKRENGVAKRDKSKEAPRTIIAKLLNSKDKEYILKNAHHLKGTNIYVYEDF